MRKGMDFHAMKKTARIESGTGQDKAETLKLPERSILPLCRLIYLEFTIRSQKWGLPTNVSITLMSLYLHPEIFGPATMAKNALFPRQTMTFILDTFEKKALAVRKPHPNDRRRKIVQLTPKGRKLAAAMFKDFLNFEQKALQPIADSELNTLKASLTRYAHALASQNTGGQT